MPELPEAPCFSVYPGKLLWNNDFLYIILEKLLGTEEGERLGTEEEKKRVGTKEGERLGTEEGGTDGSRGRGTVRN